MRNLSDDLFFLKEKFMIVFVEGQKLTPKQSVHLMRISHQVNWLLFYSLIYSLICGKNKYPPKQDRFEESLGHLRIFPWKFLTLKVWILNSYYLISKFSFHLLVNMRKLSSNYHKNSKFRLNSPVIWRNNFKEILRRFCKTPFLKIP